MRALTRTALSGWTIQIERISPICIGSTAAEFDIRIIDPELDPPTV